MIRLLIGGSGILDDTRVVLLPCQDLTEMISSEHLPVEHLTIPQLQLNKKRPIDIIL